MKIIFKKDDIKDVIRLYYKNVEGIDVIVTENESNNINEMYKVSNLDESSGFFIQSNEIQNMIKAALNSFGFEVINLKIDYGNKHINILDENSINREYYVPYFYKVTANCKFADKKTYEHDIAL